MNRIIKLNKCNFQHCTLLISPILSLVQTYPDIFESATFSFRIKKPDSPFPLWRADSNICGLIRMPDSPIRVHGSRIQLEKGADSKISGDMWIGPSSIYLSHLVEKYKRCCPYMLIYLQCWDSFQNAVSYSGKFRITLKYNSLDFQITLTGYYRMKIQSLKNLHRIKCLPSKRWWGGSRFL